MRHKRFLSTVVATALVASTMAMPVMAEDGGSFDVQVTTKTPVIRVVVPTTMEIAVNQFEMGDAGSQIYSNAFEMENKSEIPVKMNITSTATTADTTTLVATKAAATSSENEGDAWLAVAAQTSAGKYIEDATKTINDLTEESDNVTTFADKKAEQTYYLNASNGMKYKLLNTSEDATDIQYAQFYELTKKTFTASSETAELKEILKEKDIYMIATSDIGDGAEVTKVVDSDTLTWASTNTYYEVAQTATAKTALDSSKLYLYGDGATDTAKGKAAFRYIGKLSGKKETWADTDISQVSVAYKIVGVQQNDYNALAAETGVLSYGLYKAPAPAAPSITETSLSGTNNVIHFTVPSGVALDKVELVKADQRIVALASGTHYTLDAATGTITIIESVLSNNVGSAIKVYFNDNPATVKTLSIVQ